MDGTSTGGTTSGAGKTPDLHILQSETSALSREKKDTCLHKLRDFVQALSHQPCHTQDGI